MERYVFCLVFGLFSVGCFTHAQTQKINSNVPSNFNVENVSSNLTFDNNSKFNTEQKSSNGKMASQSKLYNICGNPKVQCKSNDVFEESDLSFELTGELEWFGRYKSSPFFAIILKTRKVIVESPPADKIQQECGGQFKEDERLEAQKLFPENKVFSSAFGCYEGTHEYTNVDYNFNFMAVYGGKTITKAKTILKKAISSGKFPGANIRKMQAILCHGCH